MSAPFLTTYDVQPFFGFDKFKQQGYTGKGIYIAIVDTGIRKEHQSFQLPNGQTKVVAEKHFIESNVDKSPQDHHGHGTATASIAAGLHWTRVIGENQYVFEGVAIDAMLVNAKGLSAWGTGSTVGLNMALEWAAAKLYELNPKIQIISCSWGMSGEYHGSSNHSTLIALLQKYPRLIIFFAAGNSDRTGPPKGGYGSICCPADGKEVFAVGGVACKAPRLDAHASFSSVGPTFKDKTIIKPEVCCFSGNLNAQDWWVGSTDEYIRVPWITSQTAPVPGTVDRGINYTMGTSFSCPAVSGACGLLAEKYPDKEREWYLEKLIQICRPVPNP